MPQAIPQFISGYPEVIVALILSIVMLFTRGAKGTRLSVPAAFTAPAAQMLARFPKAYVLSLETKLNHGGLRGNSYFATLAALKIYPALLSPLVWLFFDQPLLILVVMLAFFFLPDIVLFFIVKKRKAAIANSLPQALDLMVLCVDAGLGLDATISKVATEKSGVPTALSEELLTLGRDIVLGMNREKAYLELYNRTGVDELRALAAALNQSSQLGISVSKVLRNQAEFLRSKLSQKAEEKAAKLPVYMAFPLWFCIMPALMVLVLAPSLIIFFQQVAPMTMLPK